MLIFSTHSLWYYCAFLQHWHSREATSSTRVTFTFLSTSTSDSSLLKSAFQFLISPLNLDIVLLVCSSILSNKSIIWFESVFCVNPVITSVKSNVTTINCFWLNKTLSLLTSALLSKTHPLSLNFNLANSSLLFFLSLTFLQCFYRWVMDWWILDLRYLV